MDPLSSILIAKALDGLTTRAEATAANIANANSPNYRPLRVQFEESLRAALAGGETAVARVRPETTRAPMRPGSAEMRLDLELATASQTSLRYSALLEVLGRQMAISRAAVTGGR